jgi:ParB family chromosome partitioning protein
MTKNNGKKTTTVKVAGEKQEISEDHRAIMVPLDRLLESPDNPRSKLGDLSGLTASIEAVGVLVPLLIVPLDDTKEFFRVVAGHRRRAAALEADGVEAVPAIIRTDWRDDDQEQQVIMMIEALHREDLNPLDRAQAFHKLVETGLEQKVIAERVGVSTATVSKSLSVLRLPGPAQAWVRDGAMRLDDAATMAALPEAAQKELVKRQEPPSEYHLQNAKDKAKRDAAMEKKLVELEKAGKRVIRRTIPYANTGDTPKVADRNWLSGHGIELKDHRKLDCHVYAKPGSMYSQEPVEGCDKPANHVDAGEATKGAAPKKTSADRKQEARVAQAEQIMARLKPFVVRRLNTDNLTASADFVAIWVFENTSIDDSGIVAAELLGVKLSDEENPSDWEAFGDIETEVDRGNLQPFKAIYALALAEGLEELDCCIRAGVKLGGTGSSERLLAHLRTSPDFDEAVGEWTELDVEAPKADEPEDSTEGPTETGAVAETPPSTDAEAAPDLPAAGDSTRWPSARQDALRVFTENDGLASAGDKTDGSAHTVSAASLAWLEERELVEDLGDGTYGLTETGWSAVPKDDEDTTVESDAMSAIEAEVEQSTSDAQANRDDKEPVVELPRPTPTYEEKRAGKVAVSCSACGPLGQTPATTDAFAKERWDDHLWEQHGVATGDDGLLYIEVEVAKVEGGFLVSCSEHGNLPGHDDYEASHLEAQGHLDGVHGSEGTITDREAVSA